jgi:hypothetical protein
MGNRSKREHSEEVDSDPSIRSYFMRRRAAGIYLTDKYGHGSEKTLAKLACLGGGPEFHKAGGRVVLYTKEALDAWALAQISGPLKSTSEAAAAWGVEDQNAESPAWRRDATGEAPITSMLGGSRYRDTALSVADQGSTADPIGTPEDPTAASRRIVFDEVAETADLGDLNDILIGGAK